MPDPSDSRRFAASSPGASNWLQLDVVDEDGAWASMPDAHEFVSAAGRAVAAHERLRSRGLATACIALSDDATVRDLNARYRSKDKATNVLSFPAVEQRAGSPGQMLSLGDVVIARETVFAEAREQGIAPEHHLQHLVVHGLLHLLGFDHEADEEARDMEGLETEILRSLGISDPYADPGIDTEGSREAAPARLRGHA